jgi:hypothetical protein
VTKRGKTAPELPTHPRIYQLPEEVGAPENRLWLSEDEYQIIDEDELRRQWEKRPFTLDELADLGCELEAHRDKLPPELFASLDKLICLQAEPLMQQEEAGPWPRERTQHTRWWCVREAIKEGRKREAAYDDAVARLADTPAACGRHMMKKDYDEEQRQIGWLVDVLEDLLGNFRGKNYPRKSLGN